MNKINERLLESFSMLLGFIFCVHSCLYQSIEFITGISGLIFKRNLYRQYRVSNRWRFICM